MEFNPDIVGDGVCGDEAIAAEARLSLRQELTALNSVARSTFTQKAVHRIDVLLAKSARPSEKLPVAILEYQGTQGR